MAEIKAANLAGYINPKAPPRDIEGSALRQKQMAMQESLHKYKMMAMQESMNQNNIKKKSDDWVAKNANLLYQGKANALDVNSQYFNDPNRMSELMADYKENVGGNYAAFQEFRKMGVANEARANRRSLEILREDYTSDKDFKRAINNKLKDMPEEMRNKLFSNLDDDSYMAVSNVYDVDKSYTWRDSLPDIVDENPGNTAIGVGGTLASAGAILALYKRKKFKEGNELLKKTAGKVPTTMNSKKWMTDDAGEYKKYQDYLRDTKKKFFDLNGDGPDAKKVADKIFNDKGKKGFNEWKNGQGRGTNTTKATGKGGNSKGMQFDNATGKWRRPNDMNRSSNTSMTFVGKGFSRTGGSSSRASDIKYDWMKKQGRILGKNDSLGPVMPGNTGGPGFKKQQRGTYEPPVRQTVQSDGSKISSQSKKQKKFQLNENQIQDAEFSASKKIPKSKMALYEQNIRNLNRGGQMSDQEANIIRNAMKKLSKGGATFSQGDVVEEIMKSPIGKDIVEKVSSGAISSKLGIIGAGVAGAYLGGFLGGGVGSVFGEKGEAVGDIIGTTAGAVGIVPAVNLIVDKVKKQGVKNVMAKVTTRLGAKTAMKLMASGIFAGATSGFTGGVSAFITAGFIASDIFAIYDILNEEE